MAGLGQSGSAPVVAAAYKQFQAPQQMAQNKGNFLTHLIPTLGGTAGGIGGGALGGALAGSAILPGVGTVAGGLLGALLGGAAGGAGGKAVENHIEHQALGNGVLGAGIENGVLSAGPLRLLKGGAALAGAGKGLAESLIAPVAAHGAEQAVADTALHSAETGGRDLLSATTQATAQPLKTSFAGKLDDYGIKQLGKQYGTLNQPEIRQTDPYGTIKKLADLGITKDTDAERIANSITGSHGLMNQAVVKAIGGAGKVPISSVKDVMEQAITEHGLVDKEAKQVRSVVEAQLGKLGDTTDADPSKVLDVMKSIEKRIANLGGKGGNFQRATPERLDQADALTKVHDELQNSLYAGAGANANVKSVLTPELKQQLLDLHPNNQQWADHINNDIMKAKTVNELRGVQAPFVNISKIIDNRNANSFSFGGKAGNAIDNGQIPSIRGLVASTVASAAKNPVSRAVGTTARNIARTDPQNALQAAGAFAAGAGKGAGADAGGLLGALSAPGAKSIIRNEALIGAPLAMANGGQVSAQTPDSGQGYTTDQIAQMQGDPSQSNPATAQTAQDDTSSPLNPANVEQGVQAILAGGGKMSDVTAYVSLVKTLSDLKGTGAAKPLNSTQQQQANTASSGIDSIQKIAQTLQQNPHAAAESRLPGGSLSARLTGTGEYQAAIANATDAIGRLRSGGAISADEQKNFLRFLPSAFDPPQTVNYKLTQLNNIFQRFANPSPAAADPTSLLSSLGAQ